jgi:hypothetical protein
MSDDQQPEYGLVMPFVNVASKGGPYDDSAYCAGWAMGKLDALLDVTRPPQHSDTIRTADVAQADLVAMRYGYEMTHADSEVEGWAFAEFTLRVEVSDAG